MSYPVGPARKPTSRRSGGPGNSRWLSFAGGISVAYVFVHLLPELSAGQRTLSAEVTVGRVAPTSLASGRGPPRAHARRAGGRHCPHS